ncbi:MAG: thiaminase II [Anaerolineae bacterium]|nr:thiaminase II [Anaerolineae bacterium]
MSFSHTLLQRAQPYIDAQVKKPFLQGLINGDLPTACFEYWLRVDYPYLFNFLKVLSLGVVKADDPQDIWVMLDHMRAIQDEMQDHQKHAARLGLTHDDLINNKMGPLKYSYTRHQLSAAYQGPIGDVQASILACQWGYGAAARTLLREKPLQPDNPYKDWFAFHAAERHLDSLNLSLDLLDRQAAKSTEEQKAHMERIFMTSVEHETMLWDEYYNMTQWESYPLAEAL